MAEAVDPGLLAAYGGGTRLAPWVLGLTDCLGIEAWFRRGKNWVVECRCCDCETEGNDGY
jgi:hypothetical protein